MFSDYPSIFPFFFIQSLKPLLFHGLTALNSSYFVDLFRPPFLPFLCPVCHVSDLPHRGGCLPAHQLLQLQLLVLHGSVHRWADLPALERAWQTQTPQGENSETPLVKYSQPVGIHLFYRYIIDSCFAKLNIWLVSCLVYIVYINGVFQRSS